MTYKRLIAAAFALLLFFGFLPEVLPAAHATPPKGHCSSSISPDGHHWWTKYYTTEATCTKAGSIHYVCDYCGEDYYETIKAKGHKWGSWTVSKQATCTNTGKRSHVCTVCGAKETDTIKKTDHSWGEWTIVEPATDFSAGSRTHTCKVCSTSKTASYDPDGTLRRGDKGEAVKSLQQALNAAGYDCGKADGIFGKKTEKAVNALEADHGIEQDGVAWPGVQAWLSQPSQQDPADSAGKSDNDNSSGYGWKAPQTEAPADDHCVISDAQADGGTLNIAFCPEHKSTADMIESMLAQYENDPVRKEAIWHSAALLWQKAANKEYDELLTKADPSQAEAIRAEREQFSSQHEAYKAALLSEYAGEPLKAHERIAGELAYHAAELCFISNTAPNAGKAGGDKNAMNARKEQYLSELDSITNTRYRAAGTEAQALIAAERISFGEWLGAREAMLRQLYAGDSASVSELMAQAIYRRVSDLAAE